MKVTGNLVLIFFLGSMFVGLFHMSHMDMHAGMSDCPFMSHEEMICPMNLLDHIGAWKSVFLSVAQSLESLLVTIGVAILITVVAPNLLRRQVCSPPPLARWMCERVYFFCYRALQDLFSDGILKPKLY